MLYLKKNKLSRQIKIVFITIYALFSTLSAQSPFFHIKELPNNIIKSSFNTIFEDHSGRIYLGANTGLLFYDGQGLHKIPTISDTDIIVTAIYQTKEDVILVGCDNGFIYQLEQGQLSPLNPEEGLPKARITGFQEDSFGRLWFATYGEGVYFFHDNRMYNIDEEEGLLGNDIYVIEKGAMGQIWLGTDGGISVCSFEQGKKQVKNITRDNGLPDDIVREIHADRQGNQWIGMYDHGICRFNIEKDTVDFVMEEWNYGIVNCIELFEGQELWIGTEGQGVFRYLLQENILSSVNDHIDFDKSKVKDLLKDVEGNIWILDNVHKLVCANKQFERLAVPMNNIQSILIDKNHSIWVGTEQGLFSWSQNQKGGYKKRLEHLKLNVISLFQDKFDNLWIGTFGQGVYIYHEATNKLNHFSEKEGLANNSILSIDGVNGHFWLATLGGVTEVVLKENPISLEKIMVRNVNHSNGLGSNFIYKVFIDNKERVWFGTDGRGLSVLENGEIKNYRELTITHNGKTDSINLKTIYSITEDQQGHIWFSTLKNGVFEFDGQNFHHLRLKEELREVTITSLISDQYKGILLVHPNGVAILDPKTHHLIYYDHEIGLKDINPNLNVGTCDENGNIWFADQSELIKYVSLQELLEIHPRTILNELIVNYQPIKFSQARTFKHEQNNFVFRYTGLWYTAPNKVKYRYRLKGYDPDWIYSKDNQVSYSSLPPQDYIFEVTSTENEAFHDEPVSSFSFTITKPIWQRTWFIFLSLLSALAGIYVFIKLRDQRKQRVSEIQKEMLSSQLMALKAQINPHFLFNSFNTLITLIEENQKGAVEYVERLSDFYRSMMQYRNIEVISIQEEVELVKNYTFLLKKRFGDNFTINVNVNGSSAYLAPLSLQTLVENAVKHNIISKAKPLTIDIDIENNNYVTVVNNIQKKVQSEPSTGFGLQGLKRRYELLGKQKIKIEETEKYFKVFLPLIK